MTSVFSIIIVNFNGSAGLQSAVDSLKSQTFRDFELVILDHASEDGSASNVDTSGLPCITLIDEDTNHSFAQGNNLAAGVSKGEWLILLNPSAKARPTRLENIRDGIARHPHTASFACMQLSMEDKIKLNGAGDSYLAFGIPWRGEFGLPVTRLPDEVTYFAPCGAGAVISHGGSAIFGRHSDFSIYHGTRNKIWTHWKNMPAALVPITLPVHVALTLYLLVRSHFQGHFSSMKRGIGDALKEANAIRQSPDWRMQSRQRGLWGLCRQMAWTPSRMGRRATHIRPLSLTKPAQE